MCVFEKVKNTRGLPEVLRVDNGPEFLIDAFVDWSEKAGIMIRDIEPGEPNQNAYIERFNRTYRNEILDLYLFYNLEEVRETTYWWMIDCNEERPHDSLADMTPAECMVFKKENSILSVSTK